MSNNTTKVNNPMKVITGKDTRWSYANVWEAKSINGGAPKFSVSLIIPKSDTVTVQKIKAAIEAAYEKAKAQLEQLRATKAAREAQAEAIGAFMFEVQELDALTEFDEKLWLTVIDTVTVHADGRMTFKFQGGKTLTSY